MKIKIQDFGEKIGGARKDTWVGGITSENLYQMNDAEKAKFVNRNGVFPLPNAKKQVDDGLSPFVALWQRKARTKLKSKPIVYSDDNFDEVIAKYVEEGSNFKDKVMAVKSEKDIMAFYVYLYMGNPWPTYVNYDLRYLSSNHAALKKYIRKTNFPYNSKKFSGKKKSKFIPPQLEYIEREGENYRHNRNIRPNVWMEEFGFRGTEFGNWMSQKDRQCSMNYCYDALKDLATVLDINDMDISFNGKLAIAFGARGRGNASAHYELEREVINLTKMHGAGCTAHEWFHALDDRMARFYKCNEFTLASEQVDKNSLPNSLKMLCQSIKYDSSGNITDFYRGSKSFDKHFSKDSFGYWSSTPEMLARAFACYIKDSLCCKSDYLIAHADTYQFKYDDQSICAIPQGEEREILNELFDQLIYELKADGVLSKRKYKKEKNQEKIQKIELKEEDFEFYEDLDGQLSLVF